MAFYTGRPTGRNITSDVAQLAQQMAQGGTGTTLNAVPQTSSVSGNSPLASTSPSGAESFNPYSQDANSFSKWYLDQLYGTQWTKPTTWNSEFQNVSDPLGYGQNVIDPEKARTEAYNLYNQKSSLDQWGFGAGVDYQLPNRIEDDYLKNKGFYDTVPYYMTKDFGGGLQGVRWQDKSDLENLYRLTRQGMQYAARVSPELAGARTGVDEYLPNLYGMDNNYWQNTIIPAMNTSPDIVNWSTWPDNGGLSRSQPLGAPKHIYDLALSDLPALNQAGYEAARNSYGSQSGGWMERYGAPALGSILAAIASFYIGGALAAPAATAMFGTGAGTGAAAVASSVGSGMSGLASAGGAAGLAGGSLAAGGLGAASGLGSMAGGLAGGGVGLGSAGGSAALGSALSTATGNALVNTVTGAAKNAGSGDWRDITRGGLAGGLGSYLGAGINEVLPVSSIGTDGGIMSLSQNASPEEFAQALMNTGMGQFRQAMTPEYWANKVANQFGQEMLGQTLETILPSAKGDVVSDYFNRYMRQQQLTSGNVQGNAAEAMDTGSPEAMQAIQQDPNLNYNPTVTSGVAAPSYLDQLFSVYTQAQNREPEYGVSRNKSIYDRFQDLQRGIA